MYIFLEDPKTLAEFLKEKYSKLNMYLSNNHMTERWGRAYSAYYGRGFSTSDGTRIGSVGEQGELSTITINHLRNLILHVQNLVTSQRIVFDSQALNSDLASRNGAIIANHVLEYYFKDKNFEQMCKNTLEMSLVFGTAFMKVCWVPGQRLAGTDGKGQPVFSGAPKFKAFSPLDVILEPFKQDYSEQNWVVTREIVNKYDLMATYPEQADKIEKLPRIADLQNFFSYQSVEEDHVFIYKAYHKTSPTLLNGRMTVFCDDNIILDDGPNPYKDFDDNAILPVLCLRPAVIFGSSYGHTPIFDLLPIQEAMNILDSSILTNQEAFATQNITVARAAGIDSTRLSGGMNIVEYDVVDGAPNGGRPEPMNLCATPPEVFNQRAAYKLDMETLSGVNSAMRGQPQNTLVSGTAIALVASQSKEFNSMLESEYIGMVEQAASQLVTMLSRYMKTSEVIAISGKSNSYPSVSFTGTDLESVRSIKITVGNPLSKTQAGRLEIANNLVAGQMIKNPDQYMEVIQSGTITPILESATMQESYVRLENEWMSKGQKPLMLALDDHAMHLQEHQILLFRPEVRQNSDIAAVVLAHIQEHIDMLEQLASGNPMVLSLALRQPLQLPVPDPSTGFGPNAIPQQAGDGMQAPPQEDAAGSQTVQAVEEGGAEQVAQGAIDRAEKLTQEG